MVSTGYIIVTVIIEIIVYTFHASILLLLFCKRKTIFRSPFYNILRTVLFIDLIVYGMMILQNKIPLLFVDFFKNNSYMGSITLLSLGYFSAMQFYGHLMMSLNRFTIFWFPLRHDKIWYYQWYTAAMFLLPFFQICYRLNEPVIFIFGNENTVDITLENKQLMSIVYFTSATVYTITTLLAAILNILSLIKYYFYKHSSTVREKSLFFLTCLIFITQVIRLAYNFSRPLFASNPVMTNLLIMMLPIISDIFAWVGSIFLLLLRINLYLVFAFLITNFTGCLIWEDENELSARNRRIRSFSKATPTRSIQKHLVSTTFIIFLQIIPFQSST